MATRMGMALVGLGAASQPHLRSLQDLMERIDLRYAITRSPHPDRIKPYTGLVQLERTLEPALKDPKVQGKLVLGNPRISPAYSELYYALWKDPNYGEAFFQKLAGQKPRVVQTAPRKASAVLADLRIELRDPLSN